MPDAQSQAATDELVDAKTALQQLGVKPQTLYAYVSRGLIRSVARAGSQQSLYHRQDIEALRMRGRSQAGHRNTAERSLHVGGDAVMQTSITKITGHGPLYRGLSAVELAQQRRPLEDVAELLWGGVLPLQTVWWDAPVLPASFQTITNAIGAAVDGSNSRRILSLCIEAHAMCAGADAERRLGGSVLVGRHLLQVMAGALGYLRTRPRFMTPPDNAPLGRSVLLALEASDSPQVSQAIDGALIMCADHELAPSTFAARIAASTGADIHSCVCSALGAFEGAQTGFGTDRAEELLRECSTPTRYVAALRAIAERKQPLPGFNHPLYPDGDPRAAYLLSVIRELGALYPNGPCVLDCVRMARTQLNAAPALGIALAGLVVTLELPLRSAGVLMALGRCVGWIAHVFEQRLNGLLVRPRAEYVDPEMTRR